MHSICIGNDKIGLLRLDRAAQDQKVAPANVPAHHHLIALDVKEDVDWP
jgi:hypothetical protein